MEDWTEIRRLHRSEQMPIKVIARVLRIWRNTARAAIASDGAPKYERKAVGSIMDAVELRIRELLQASPRMLATVIAERIGWTRSIRVLSRPRVESIRNLARHLGLTAEVGDGWRAPRGVRQSRTD